jgi:hypothetical protein
MGSLAHREEYDEEVHPRPLGGQDTMQLQPARSVLSAADCGSERQYKVYQGKRHRDVRIGAHLYKTIRQQSHRIGDDSRYTDPQVVW